MQPEQTNVYEQAFEYFLAENKLPFIWVDQSKRPKSQSGPVKNFDFLIHPDTNAPLLIKLKGRTFKGTSLAGLKDLDGWVTFEERGYLPDSTGYYPLWLTNKLNGTVSTCTTCFPYGRRARLGFYQRF